MSLRMLELSRQDFHLYKKFDKLDKILLPHITLPLFTQKHRIIKTVVRKIIRGVPNVVFPCYMLSNSNIIHMQDVSSRREACGNAVRCLHTQNGAKIECGTMDTSHPQLAEVA